MRARLQLPNPPTILETVALQGAPSWVLPLLAAAELDSWPLLASLSELPEWEPVALSWLLESGAAPGPAREALHWVGPLVPRAGPPAAAQLRTWTDDALLGNFPPVRAPSPSAPVPLPAPFESPAPPAGPKKKPLASCTGGSVATPRAPAKRIRRDPAAVEDKLFKKAAAFLFELVSASPPDASSFRAALACTRPLEGVAGLWGSRRAGTLSKFARALEVCQLWLTASGRGSSIFDAREEHVIDYLLDRSDEPCGVTVPEKTVRCLRPFFTKRRP